MTDHASSLRALTSDRPPVLPGGATPDGVGTASPVDGGVTAGGTATPAA